MPLRVWGIRKRSQLRSSLKGDGDSMKGFMAVMLGLMLCGYASAGIVFQDQMGGVEDPWSHTPDGADPTSNWAHPGGILTSTSTSGDDAREYVYTSDLGAIGDWSAAGVDIRTIKADFYADSGVGSGAASLVTLFFYDAGTDQHWFYNLTPYGGWTHYSVPVVYSYWYTTDGPDGYADWQASLASVDQVGIYLAYQPGEDVQTYAIDNFILDDAFETPEPGTFYFLGAAFASMGFGFRKRIREFANGLLKKS